MDGFTHETTISKSVEWFTPEWIFKALGVRFDLDPCSPGEGLTHVPADKHLTKLDDGLTTDWWGDVWVNPPYGRGIESWLDKCADLAERGGNAIALVPNRTDTRWFQDAASKANAIHFPAKRIKFHPGSKDAPCTGSPGTGSALIGYGSWAQSVLMRCHLPGFVAAPRAGYFNIKADL